MEIEFNLEPIDLGGAGAGAGGDGGGGDFELEEVDLGGLGTAPGAATPPRVHGGGLDTSALDFDEAAFAVSLQQLEADMNASVAQHREQHARPPSGSGGCCHALASRCTPAPGSACAKLVARLVYAAGWCSHALAAADYGLDLAFAASIADAHPGHAALLCTMATVGALVGVAGHYNRRYNPEIQPPGATNGAVSLNQVLWRCPSTRVVNHAACRVLRACWFG